MFFLNEIVDFISPWDVPAKPKPEGVEVSQQIPERGQFVYGEFVRMPPQRVRSYAKETVDNGIPNNTIYAQLFWSVGQIEQISQVFVNDKLTTLNVQHFLDGGEHTYNDGYSNPITFDGKGHSYSVIKFVLGDGENDFREFPEITASGLGRKVKNLLNADVVEYTNNSACVLFDYMTDPKGGAVPLHRIDKQSFIDEAAWAALTNNEHDATANQVPNSVLNIKLDGNAKPSENINIMRKSVRAYLPRLNGGVFKLKIEREGLPVAQELTDADAMGDFKFKPTQKGKRYNQVVVTYPSKEQWGKDRKVSYPEDNSAELAQDNNVPNILKIRLDGINSHYYALQMAKLLFERSRKCGVATWTQGKNAKSVEIGDIVNVTNAAFSMLQKPFIVIERERSANDVFKFTLLEYQESIYPWVINPVVDIPDNTLPDFKTAATPTGLAVDVAGNSQALISWDSSLNQFEVYLDDNLVYQGSNKSVEVNGFDAGIYTVTVIAINGLGYRSSAATVQLDLQLPSAPTIAVTKTALSITIKPTLSNLAFDTYFEFRYSLTDDVETAQDGGNGFTLKIDGVQPSTTYYLWARTVNLTGVSAWTSQTVTTDAQAANIVAAIDQQIDIGNLSPSAQLEIAQIKTDIVSNANSSAASQLGVSSLRTQLESTETNLSDTFTAAFNVINDNVEFRQELLGYKGQVTALEDQVNANATSITQSATKIELESVKVELKGDIQNIVTGDIDALLDAAIGDLEGEVTQVKFFIGEDKLDGQQTITSFVNNIVLGQDFVTINEVQQQIDAGGITGIVKQTDFDIEITTLSNNIETLTSNNRLEYLSTFAFQTESNTSINAALVEAQFKTALAEISLAQNDQDFKGSLATARNETQVVADELSSQVETTNEQLARIDNNISITNQTLNNTVNETKALAKIQTELKASLDDGLGAAVLRLDQAEADIQGNANAVSIVQGQVDDENTGLAASYQLAQEAQTTANGAVSSVTVLENTINDETSGLSATLVLATSASEAAANNATDITGLKTSTASISAVANTGVENAATAQTTAENAQSSADTANANAGNAQTAADNAADAAANASQEASAAVTLAAAADEKADAVAAEAFLYVDVNGKIAGFKASAGDATPSALTLIGDKVTIESPDGSITGLSWDSESNKFVFDGEVFAREITGDVIELAEKDFSPTGTLAIGTSSSKTLLGQFVLQSTGFNRTIKIDSMAITIPTSGDAVTISLEKVITGNFTSVKNVFGQYNQANQIQTPPLIYNTDGAANTYRVYAYRALSGGQPPYFPKNTVLSVLVNKSQGSITIT